jgi:hypothetical protein
MTPAATLNVLFSASENAALTKGILAETLWILSGQPNVDGGTALLGQLSDPNMATALVWASRTGLISGEVGYATANEALTREQAAAVLCRYAAARGKDVSVSSDLSAWADGYMVRAENAMGVIWALERGLMNGYGDGYLRPTQTATCGEAIVMIRTMQQKL